MLSNNLWLFAGRASLGEAPSGQPSTHPGCQRRLPLMRELSSSAAIWGGSSYHWLHHLLAQAGLAAAGQLCFSLAKSLSSGQACASLDGLLCTLPAAGHSAVSVSGCPVPLASFLLAWGAVLIAGWGLQSWITVCNTGCRQV